MSHKKKYISPAIRAKKIKLNFFFSQNVWYDQFNVVGKVYAQYGDSSTACDTGVGDNAS